MFELDKKPAKLITSRRAIAAGIASLLGVPVASAAGLDALAKVPLTLDPNNLGNVVEQNGLWLNDYRFPMSRLIYEDGTSTAWHKYIQCMTKSPSAARKESKQGGRAGARAVSIEICAPDRNGMPRYTQLEF
jgi:hypothetical protein